jgi:hypothetical protein
MKTITMKWALMAITLGSMFFSCKKEKSSTSECSISMDGLSGSYKLTALQYKSNANAAPVDYFSYMDDCEKDDILILKNDGTYKVNDAGTVCTPSNAQNGSWLVSGNKLISDGILNGTVASYDCKTLVYYTENSIVAGDRLTFTMVKQ